MVVEKIRSMLRDFVLWDFFYDMNLPNLTIKCHSHNTYLNYEASCFSEKGDTLI